MLLRGYRHDHSKLVLAGGAHALACGLYLTDGAVEVSQVTGQGPLVHWGEGDRASWSQCQPRMAVPLLPYLPNQPTFGSQGHCGQVLSKAQEFWEVLAQ